MGEQTAFDRAREGSPFSNGTMWDIWSWNWCMRCRNDGMGVGKDQPQCELILVALCGRTPLEWITLTDEDAVFGNYHCINFRDRNDRGPREPKPRPDPPGQMSMLPREPFETGRVLLDVPDEVAVDA